MDEANDHATIAWLDAIRWGSRYASARSLLRDDQDVNVRGAGGVTALQIAAEAGDLATMKKLFKDGADMAIANDDGRTPLMVALYTGRLSAIRYLQDRAEIARALAVCLGRAPTSSEIGDIVALRSNRRFRDIVREELAVRTGIVIALARSGDLKAVRYMVEHTSANVNAVDSVTGETAFSAALANGWWGVCEYLLTKGAHAFAPCIVDHKHQSAMLTAVRNHDPQLVRHLGACGARLDSPFFDIGTTPLAEAARMGAIDLVDSLLEIGATLTSSQCRQLQLPSLMWAVLEARPDIERVDRTPWLLLAIACWQQDVRLLEYLLETQLALQDRTAMATHGVHALFLAVYQVNQAIVSELLAKGASIHERLGIIDYTAIVAAIFSDSVLMLHLLLEQGAFVQAEYARGSLLPLGVAARAIECIRVLLPLEQRVAMRDHALIQAVYDGDSEIVQILLDAFQPSSVEVLTQCVTRAATEKNPLLIDMLLQRCCCDELPMFNGVSWTMGSDSATRSVLLAHGAVVDVHSCHEITRARAS